MELPERAERAVQAAREEVAGEGAGIEDAEAKSEEGLLEMPAVTSLIDLD